MPAIGLAEAARLSGRNQSTIHRAMKAGRLSYTKDETGERRIDTAELDRVFRIKNPSQDAAFTGNGASSGNDAQSMQSKVAHEPESERVIAAQQVTIDQLDATIRDLRARLDAETEERRKLIAILTGPTRVPWWRRRFRA